MFDHEIRVLNKAVDVFEGVANEVGQTEDRNWKSSILDLKKLKHFQNQINHA
jgi:hypothetical protein